MSETPDAAAARKAVDEMEDRIVDVGSAMEGEPDETQENLDQDRDEPQAQDESPAVPGSPEPTD